MTSSREDDSVTDEHKSRPLSLDRYAMSSNPAQPAFIAPPEGAPVYYGFSMLEDVAVDGFTLGAITDFESERCNEGDAFVVAPDGSRAGLVWEVSARPSFSEVLPLEERRWGVWAVSLRHPMTSRANALKNLASILPELKTHWHEWKRRYGNAAEG